MHESAMDDNESFEALEAQNCELGKELDEEDDDDDDDEEEEEVEEEERFGEVQSLVAPIEAEFTKSQPETLAVSSSIPFSETDRHANLATSSSQQLLTGGADERTMTRVIDLEGMGAVNSLVSGEFKEQVGALHEEVFAGVTVQAAEPRRKNQLGCSQCPTSSSELSPTSVTQSTLSDPSPTTFERRLSPIPKANNGCLPETEHQNSFDLKAISAVHIVKTPSADGYNWRKYGQKLVKSTKGSRSYYKCTYAECCSKKIKCSDHSGGVIEIIYKGPHNHEPPRKVNSTKESKLAASAGSNLGNSHIAHPVKSRNLLDPSSSSREPIQETSPLPEPKRQKSRDSDGNVEVEVKVKDEQVAEPEPKQRLKKSDPAHPGPLKPGKKPKLVLHAAGDVGISSDGYRWRKYGQKMVKGNPHPRNYYRCTSAGCPVRKHIERATENTSALIITYKGVHDHDMPVPKKRHGPPSAHLVAAAAPASMSNLQLKSCDALKNQTFSTQWSLDTEGELTGEALDVGGEKVIESARTLLSIGFEIKPC